MQVHPFYYARHSAWKGPFTLLGDGTFVGGSYRPNGHWKISGDLEFLTVQWHCWQQETLRRTVSGGYRGERLVLEKVSADSNCYESHKQSLQHPLANDFGRGLYGYALTGLCDRITTLLALKSMADKTNRRLRWGWPQTSACNCSFQKLFECDEVEVLNVHVPLGRQISERGGMNRSILLDLVTRNNEERWVFVEDCYLGHNYDNFDKILYPSREVRSAIQKYMDAQWRPNVIGVHLRRGDKSSHAPKMLCYFNEIDRALNFAPDAGLFVCSDDAQCENELRGRYGSRVITYPARTLCRDIEEGIIDALVCLYLLRHTDGVIGSSMSGYSLCAGWECGFVDIPSTYKNRPLVGKEWIFPLPRFKQKYESDSKLF